MEGPAMNSSLPPWLEFFTFSSENARLVLFGCVLLGLTSGVIGCFAFLRKRSLMGDALAHAALPGVCAAFLLTGTKDPIVILVGAVVACWLAALSIDLIVRHTRCKEDSALGMVLSVYFGVGVLMLTYIQRSGNAAQSGLNRFLFGQAAAMLKRDVWTFGVLSVLLIGVVVVAYKEFKVVSFDPQYARTAGVPTRLVETAMATLIVLAVAIGLQAVGVVLMAAMLVTPAAAARYWTHRLSTMLVLAGGFGALSGAIGAYVSYLGPRMPTGPWMVVSITSLFLISLFFAPRRGVFARILQMRSTRTRTSMENVLRTLYVLGEKEQRVNAARTLADLLKHRPMSLHAMDKTLSMLIEQGLAEESLQGRYSLTGAGIERAARLTRIHRLWELYLTRKLELAPDHVHDDADEIEHIITPELEERLIAALDNPDADPHASHIPVPAGMGAGAASRISK